MISDWSVLFTDLSCYGVLLHERFLGEVELKRVVSRQGDIETSGQIVRQGRPVVVEEERVVGEGRHGQCGKWVFQLKPTLNQPMSVGS